MRFLNNRVKAKLRSNKSVLGSWLNLPSLEVTEIMARSGFEFLVIDQEHGTMNFETAQKMAMVIEGYGAAPFIRVSENDPVIIKRAMETGVYGIIVPMINSKEDAQKAIASMRYAPEGIRGVGLSRGQGYGLEFEKYKQWYKKNMVLVAQIEHIDAINNLEEILSLKDIDATIIGPYDLSASLGYPGEFDRKEVINAINKYVTICKKHKVPVGMHVVPADAQLVNKRMAQGFNFLVFSLDMIFLASKIKDEMELLKKYVGKN